MNKVVLLRLKKCQVPRRKCPWGARREERGLVIPNERRTTQHGVFLGATRRAEPVSLPSSVIPRGYVVTRLCSTTTLRSLCLAGQRNRFGSTTLFIENAPSRESTYADQ